jgi:hypothetical protein
MTPNIRNTPTRQTVTLEMGPVTALPRQATDMIRLGDDIAVTNTTESVAAGHYLKRLARMRRWAADIYATARAPLAAASKTLAEQERALVQPLKIAEKRVMSQILAYEAASRANAESRARMALDAHLSAPAGTPMPLVEAAPTSLAEGVHKRETHTAAVTELEALILSIAGNLLLQQPGGSDREHWITTTCAPSPQASPDLLAPNTTALNALARSLREDLSLPGVEHVVTTILVAK